MRAVAGILLLAAGAAAKRNSSDLSPFETFVLTDCKECTNFKDTIWCTESKLSDKDTWVFAKRNMTLTPSASPYSGRAATPTVTYTRDKYSIDDKKRDNPNDVANAMKYCWAGAWATWGGGGGGGGVGGSDMCGVRGALARDLCQCP